MYTYENCLSECNSFAIYEFCKCIPYVYPQSMIVIYLTILILMLIVLDVTKVCTILDVPCLQVYHSNLHKLSSFKDS